MDPTEKNRAGYIETIETCIGLPLKPAYAKDIVLTLDDCGRVFDAISGFYDTIPFSMVPEEPSAEFVPVFTADVANMLEPGSLLAKIGQRFDGAVSSPANRLANLMVYAPRVIISDMLVTYGEMQRRDVAERYTDDEIVALVNEELRAMCGLSDLFHSGTIITYSPYSGNRGIYDGITDKVEMEVGIGMMDDPDLLKWIREEVASEFAEEWMETHVAMAIQEVAESILFTKAYGFNSGPVFSSAAAMTALNKVVNSVVSYSADALQEQQRQYRISSNSLVDLTQTDPKAIADIRFDSRAFTAWRAFIDESIEQIMALQAADAGFDASLARDMERRSADFERMLVAEFGESALARCFKFDTANIIGLVTSATIGLGGPLADQISSLLVPLVVERAYSFASGLTGDRLKAAMRSHYHAFAKRA